MEKLTFEIEIIADAQKVYETMLGLNQKSTYEYWTSAFNPSSTYEGCWEVGSKIHFKGTDENGKIGGMVSQIIENQKSKFVSIKHIGFLDGNKEVTSGEEVEKWAGAHENYFFNEVNNKTILRVEIEAVEDFIEYFTSTYPIALEKLKEYLEK